MVPVEEEENAATPPAASEACSGLAEQEERTPTTSASQHGEYAAPTFEIVISQWEQSVHPCLSSLHDVVAASIVM